MGEITGIEVIHLDKLYWRPGWVEPQKEEWKKKVEKVLARPSWIIDGNFGGTMEMRIAAADTVIFLDLPRTTCVYRILKRWLVYRNKLRPDMADGCYEWLDWKFILWIWNFPRDTRPVIEERLAKVKDQKNIIRLHSTAGINNFIGDLRAAKLELQYY